MRLLGRQFRFCCALLSLAVIVVSERDVSLVGNFDFAVLFITPGESGAVQTG
jgi:hypothetical protein